METFPIPNFRYDDGVTQLMFGPGFYGEGPPDMLGLTKERMADIARAIEEAGSHFCDNADCEKHGGVMPKYSYDDERGPGLEETISLVAHLVQPVNTNELLGVVFGVMMHAIHDSKQNATPEFMGAFSSTGGMPKQLKNILSNLFGKETDPEQEIKDLLSKPSDGNSQFGLQINPNEFKLRVGDTPWDAYGISEARADVILKVLVPKFEEAANNLKLNKDPATLTAEVFNAIEFESVAEQCYCTYILGIYSNKLHVYYTACGDLRVKG